MPHLKEQQVAIAAVTAAARLCQQIRQGSFQAFAKADQSPVTLADLGSQAIVCQTLSAAFADDSIVAEEDAQMLRQPSNRGILEQITERVRQTVPQTTPDLLTEWIDRGKGQTAARYWTLDPIDGTKGFIRGDQYAIALALIEYGQVQLGVLACPALPFQEHIGTLFVAVSGQGTTMMTFNGTSQPVQVSQRGGSDSVRLIESVESAHSDRPRQEEIARKLGLSCTPMRMDSQAKYGAVAKGDADLYLRIPLPQDSSRRENIWDHAAGAIIVEEAGGRVTDLDGQPLKFSCGAKLAQNRGIVASNGLIHEQVLGAIAACDQV
ncbi:MAG: 3'(2'),5'-bisphosphate nucleotidase [Cyanophyceae cyanobacterium]